MHQASHLPLRRLYLARTLGAEVVHMIPSADTVVVPQRAHVELLPALRPARLLLTNALAGGELLLHTPTLVIVRPFLIVYHFRVALHLEEQRELVLGPKEDVPSPLLGQQVLVGAVQLIE